MQKQELENIENQLATAKKEVEKSFDMEDDLLPAEFIAAIAELEVRSLYFALPGI